MLGASAQDRVPPRRTNFRRTPEIFFCPTFCRALHISCQICASGNSQANPSFFSMIPTLRSPPICRKVPAKRSSNTTTSSASIFPRGPVYRSQLFLLPLCLPTTNLSGFSTPMVRSQRIFRCAQCQTCTSSGDEQNPVFPADSCHRSNTPSVEMR